MSPSFGPSDELAELHCGWSQRCAQLRAKAQQCAGGLHAEAGQCLMFVFLGLVCMSLHFPCFPPSSLFALDMPMWLV